MEEVNLDQLVELLGSSNYSLVEQVLQELADHAASGVLA